MIKKISIFILLITSLLLLSACNTSENTHNDLSIDSPKIVSFNYKLYEVPPYDETFYFPFTIHLEDVKYTGSDAYIQFEPGIAYEIDEEKIKFNFENKDVTLRVRMKAFDISKPLLLNYKLYINDANNPQEINGALKINRKQSTIN